MRPELGEAGPGAGVLFLEGGAVVLSGAALLANARLVEEALAHRRRDGARTPPSYFDQGAMLRRRADLVAAAARASRERALEPPAPDEITVEAAMAITRLSDRQIRRRAERDFGGRKIGTTWLLDRSLVEAVSARGHSDVRR